VLGSLHFYGNGNEATEKGYRQGQIRRRAGIISEVDLSNPKQKEDWPAGGIEKL